MAASQSSIDAGLESRARDLEKLTNKLNENPDDSHVRILARAIQRFNLEIGSRLPLYGKEYENRGRKFIELACKAQSAAASVPEKITRIDPDADRSAHALIARSAEEIATQVSRICG